MRNLVSPRIRMGLMMLLSLLVLQGCAMFKQIQDTQAVLKQCKFELQRVKPVLDGGDALRYLQGKKLRIAFDLKYLVENPTKKNLSMNKVDLALYGDNKLLATGSTMDRVKLKAGSKTAMTARIYVDPQKVTRKLVKLLKGKGMSYYVDGTFYFDFNGLQVPLSVRLS